MSNDPVLLNEHDVAVARLRKQIDVVVNRQHKELAPLRAALKKARTYRDRYRQSGQGTIREGSEISQQARNVGIIPPVPDGDDEPPAMEDYDTPEQWAAAVEQWRAQHHNTVES